VVAESTDRGAFDTAAELGRLSRQSLCVLGREWLLHGHLQDRVGMPFVITEGGREAMQDVAIDEWMAASPVYSQRMQRALGFVGTGVDTIFKNIQLDIGSPHQFMDFRYILHDQQHGEFQLAWCGALMDVEPMGEEFVHGMCHTIEDPTFDATAGATNPQAIVRPIHRPPRVPEHREPHCAWTVAISDGPPAVVHPNLETVQRSRVASIALPALQPLEGAEPGGWPDYSGPFDPEFGLEDLSHHALVVTLREIALQSHLLIRSFLLSVQQRFGEASAQEMAPRILAGLGGLTSQRIAAAMEVGDGVDGIARLLRLHPMLNPSGYMDTRVERLDEYQLRVAVTRCPAVDETDDSTWAATLERSPSGRVAFETLVRGVEPRARVHETEARADEQVAFTVVVDPAAEPAPESVDVQLARFSTGADFVFVSRRPLRMTDS
jgi:hypothetical protein